MHLPFHIYIVAEAWDLAACTALRQMVFCDEQGLFVGSDQDAIDEVAITLAAVSSEQVVGTVRIHEALSGEAVGGLWFGSRLAVRRDVRRAGGIGAELIRHAVGFARARGANDFRAHVQQSNVAMFHALHWHILAPILLHGYPHTLMQADLAFYPALDAGAATPLRSAA